MMRPPNILIAAGSDPCSGAGLPADLRTCLEQGCWGMGVMTAVVVQSTRGVRSFTALPSDLVLEQWREIVDDAPPAAIKLGMLGSEAVLRCLQEPLERARGEGVRVVCDPVLAAEAGDPLTGGGGDMTGLFMASLPLFDVFTPNIPEAERLLGLTLSTVDDAKEAAATLCAKGARHVLLKGGHLPGAPADVWASAQGVELMHNRVLEAVDSHGTGCQLASALACQLAQGCKPRVAAERARQHLLDKLVGARFFPGRGRALLGFLPYKG